MHTTYIHTPILIFSHSGVGGREAATGARLRLQRGDQVVRRASRPHHRHVRRAQARHLRRAEERLGHPQTASGHRIDTINITH